MGVRRHLGTLQRDRKGAGGDTKSERQTKRVHSIIGWDHARPFKHACKPTGGRLMA